MAQTQVYRGTPEQLVERLNELPHTQKYKMIVFPEEQNSDGNLPTGIVFGMFPQLQSLSENDFVNAEWRGKEFEF